MTVEIYQLESDVWVHASVGKNTAHLRNRSNGGDDLDFDLANDVRKTEFEEIRDRARRFTVAQVRAFLEESDSRHIELGTFEDRDQWLAAFEILGQLAADGYDFNINDGAIPTDGAIPPDGQYLIPQTSLRRFYETLRKLFTGIEITTLMVNFLSDRGRSRNLSKLFDDSVRHFRRYENFAEGFHARDNNLPRAIDRYIGEPRNFANCLQARLRSYSRNGLPLTVTDGETAWQVKYVDYEISPYRTTGRAAMEDGRVGVSGVGGMDLLLVDDSGDRPIPIIGEIKADSDRDLFLALIQSLVYTVEIGSGTQLERLKTFYPNSFETLANDSQVDIYLLFEGKTDEVALFDEALDLARQLFTYEGEFRQLVRSVKFIKVELGVGDQEVTFVVERSVSLPLD